MINHLIIVSFLAAVFGIDNYFRGRGRLPGGRWACAIIAGMATMLAAGLLQYDLWQVRLIGPVTMIGFFDWLVWGWGLYFAAFHWKWRADEHEVPWIDWICLKLVPMITEDYHWTNGLRGTIGMSLRGLYLLPMFYLISLVIGSNVTALGFIGIVQGLVYAANHIKGIYKNKGTSWPEPVMGAIIGACVGIALIQGAPIPH